MDEYMRSLKIPVLLLGLLALLFLISSCSNTQSVVDPINKEVLEAIKNEFNLIPAMPDAIQNDYNELTKTGIIVIDSGYATRHSFIDIKDYYDSKLKEHGWQFYKEEKIYDWGRDFGGKALRYKKGEFIATVQYAGEKANEAWTYGFSISWGLKYD